MLQTEVVPLFEIDYRGALTTADVPAAAKAPILNGAIESGTFVRIEDREAHLQNTYVALSQLALASRGEAATTQAPAIRRITAANGSAASAYLRQVAIHTKERRLAARGAYMASVSSVIPESELDPKRGGWYTFRTAYEGSQGRELRDTYRAEVVAHILRFGYSLPEVS